MAEILWNFNNNSENWGHIKQTILERYILGSFILVSGTAFFSIIAGVSSAWLISCCEFPGRRFFEWALILPLAIPTYIAAYAYFDLIDLLNPFLVWIRLIFGSKTMNDINEILVYTVTIMIIGSVLYPYVYLLARASFSRQSNQLIQAAQTLGHHPKSIFWKISLPMARPAIVAGTSLVIMETLNDYGAVKHFGIPTFTTGIFRSWLGMGDMPSALRLASFLMLFILLLLLVEKVLRGNAKFHEYEGQAQSFQRYKLKKMKAKLAIQCCLIPMIFGFIIPLIRLGFWASLWLGESLELYLLKAIFNSFVLAFTSSCIAVILSIFIVFTARYFQSSFVQASNRLAILGYSVPGSIIAMGMLILAGQINNLTGYILTGSITILISAYVIRFLAISWHSIDSAMEKTCDQLNSASRSLGSSALRSLVKINIPLIKNTLVVAGLLVFIDTIKELPLTLILRPFNFETLATLTFDLTNQAQIYKSSIPALCIILVTILPILWLNQKIEYKQ
ncbi:MAG: ABC transporter permease [Candidatus Marinimicrobia bacterium]|nr:ABC transporter permease [Candidatus Neomarinimicrobiota bacterium]|tara:strand:+ start:12238 stop:13755 length:1518 start_codon:yes stop_codon:yes gene_type:complete